MKIQDYFFLIILLLLFIKRNYRLSVFLGLLAFLISIPLFSKWIFFTAERLTWYGAGFISLGIIQILFLKKKKMNIKEIISNLLNKSIKHQKIINAIFLLIITINLGTVIYQNKNQYFKFDYWQRFPKLKYTYENSQYVQKNLKVGWIPDEFVFSYAGGAFIKGVSPILIASANAPLGKYLISLSILIFNNENIVMLFFALFTLIFMYLLTNQIISNKTIALIAPLLFSFEPIFKNQLTYIPLLDLMQIPFLLGCFYFFNKGTNLKGKSKIFNFITANIFLGMFISVKFFATGFLIIFSWFLVLILRKDKNSLIILFTALPFSLFVLILSYTRIFLDGYSLRKFFGVQKWVFPHHQSKLILPFSIWPLIMMNKWYVWYGDKRIISDPQWRLTWPIAQTVSLITTILYFFKKIKIPKNLEVLLIWSLAYIIFSSFGNATARYLVIYLPVIFIISTYLISEVVILVKKKFITRYDRI